MEKRDKHVLIQCLYAAMNVRDSYHAASINAKRPAILTNVSSAATMPSRNVDVVKTPELYHATQ